MRALRHPAAGFALAGSLLLVGVVVLTSVLVSRAAEREALGDARALTGVLAHSVAEPAVPRGLASGDVGAVDRFDRAVGDQFTTGDVRRVKVWAASGEVVWSDASELIGQRFTLGEDEVAVLRDGGTEAEVSDLDRSENRLERGSGGLVEVYTRIETPEGEPLLFEVYFAASDIEQRKQAALAPLVGIAVLAPVLFLALAVPVIWVLARRLSSAAAEREGLLRRSMDASEAERRRIARDLHDGVVQELAGSAFAVAALSRDTTVAEGPRATLDEVGLSLRHTLRSLRSLLVEIHPPDLGAAGLRAALEDLTAPASAQGLVTSVGVTGVEEVTEPTAALLWRAAQEAVRNTMRHASAQRLDVTVQRVGSVARLTVADDGAGFDPERSPAEGSFGLRGLASLVRDGGGSLAVRSAEGSGTTVVVEVPL